jgi:starvation-inducible DNA-binding protein
MNNVAHIGLNPEFTQKTKDILGIYLADLHILAAKTKAFHWNIIDANFFALHEKLDEHHEALGESIDDTAERIRAIGEISPVTLKQYLEITQLQEVTGLFSGQEMFKNLLNDYEIIIRYIREQIPVIAEQHGDDATADFLISEMAKHEKTAWMIRAMVRG